MLMSVQMEHWYNRDSTTLDLGRPCLSYRHGGWWRLRDEPLIWLDDQGQLDHSYNRLGCLVYSISTVHLHVIPMFRYTG